MAIKSLPIQQTGNQNDALRSSALQQSLGPVLKNPFMSGLLLSKVTLVSGTNTIKHGLGRAIQGWIPVRVRSSAASIYDTQDSNTSPNTTLILNASAAVTIDLYVF
jgi:hypothetical protein